MIISVTKDDRLIYQQETEGDAPMNRTLAYLMGLAQGTGMVIKLQNNGHDLTFNTGPMEIISLVRLFNGVITRSKGGAK